MKNIRIFYLKICLYLVVKFSIWIGVFILQNYITCSLFGDIFCSINWLCKRATKALIILCECAGWTGPVLSANCIGHLFACSAFIISLMLLKTSKDSLHFSEGCLLFEYISRDIAIRVHTIARIIGLNVFYFIEITTQSYIHTVLIRIWTKAYCLFSSSTNTYNIYCEHLWPKHIYRVSRWLYKRRKLWIVTID